MNPPPHQHGGGSYHHQPSPPKKELQLQGPRPTPLQVSKQSHKIRKPPPHPRHPPPSSAVEPSAHLRQDPVIIYTISPKIIHANVSDFMSLVQRLTGPSTPVAAATADGQLSPAARLASIERTSPSERERLAGLVDGEGIEVGQFPGILSPAPASLPPIPAGLFSPAVDPQNQWLTQDLSSPVWQNMFMASPSASSNALFSAPLVSPNLSSPIDIFNLFDL